MSRLCLQTRQAAVATPIEGGVWLYAGSGAADFSRGKCRPHAPKEQPSANQLGFLSHLPGNCLRISQNYCCVGFVHSSSGKETEDMTHNSRGLLDGTLSQAWQRIPVVPAPARLGDCCECEASLTYIVSAEPSEPEQPCRTRQQSSECAFAKSKCSLKGRVGCVAAKELSLFICGKYCNLCK